MSDLFLPALAVAAVGTGCVFAGYRLFGGLDERRQIGQLRHQGRTVNAEQAEAMLVSRTFRLIRNRSSLPGALWLLESHLVEADGPPLQVCLVESGRVVDCDASMLAALEARFGAGAAECPETFSA